MPVESTRNSADVIGNDVDVKAVGDVRIGGGDVPVGMNLNASAPFLHTPAGNVRPLVPPPLPMAPTMPYDYTYGNGYRSYGPTFGNGYAGTYPGYSGYNSYGNSYGYSNSYRNYGSYGMPFGNINPQDPEARFIQLAEASTRPAFQSIETLVMAIGNIASMLESTFFALTSSFRAILGVAANFGRLRGVFTEFWQKFFLFRALNWLYRKFLFWLRISRIDPSSKNLNKAFAEAAIKTSQPDEPTLPSKGQSSWPIMIFLGFIFTAPYVIMRILKNVTSTVQGEAEQPSKWVSPIQTVAVYDFQARNASELSIATGQTLLIAPKEIQNALGLLNTGWALATTDGRHVGVIPINYVKSPHQMRQENLMKSLQKPVANLSQQQPSENALDSVPSLQASDVKPNMPSAQLKNVESGTKLPINGEIDFDIPR